MKPDEYETLDHARRRARRAARKEFSDTVEALIVEFNERYAVVNEAGRAVIYETTNDPVLNRQYYNRLTINDLLVLYLNRRIRVGTDEKDRAVAKIWLHHKERRQYLGGVVFDPSNKYVPTEALNLWRGLSVQPKKGSWKLLREHVRSVICGGNAEHFDYLMGWMAAMLQYPGRQGETAVVMRGGEGSGKGTLARALMQIFGQHALAISNPKHLVGDFNAHLRNCIFLFADEAFYAGDKQHAGMLKALITEPNLTIEAKYHNPVQSPNFVHLMMASNEEWVVPASTDSRRFFVLDVLPTRAGDHAYFAAIWGEMNTGGCAAMAHDLLSHDLTFFNIRNVPLTEALRQQRVLSLTAADSWWLDVLQRGYVYKSRHGLEDFFGRWHEELATDVLYAAYCEYVSGRRERHLMGREAFGRFMVGVGAVSVRQRNAVVGEHVTDDPNVFGGFSRHAKLIRNERARGYTLGSLKLARGAFSGKNGLYPVWDDEDGPNDT